MHRILPLILVVPLSGCASPVLLGEDDSTFVARLTEFRAETALPGILRAIGTDRGVRAEGCQLSMRGEVPRETIAQLRAGKCWVDLGEEAAPPEESAPSVLDGIWNPDL